MTLYLTVLTVLPVVLNYQAIERGPHPYDFYLIDKGLGFCFFSNLPMQCDFEVKSELTSSRKPLVPRR